MALAAEAAPNRPWPDPEPPDLAVPAGMHRIRFPAMGTTVSLLLPEPQAQAAGATVQDLFATWERTLSRFRPDSELSRLNRGAGTPVAVGALLWDAVATALDAAQATDGLYDPTLLCQMTALGYDRPFDHLPTHLPAGAALCGPGGGWRDIYLDRQHRRIMLPAGVGVDLGGLAKGLAVDTALALLQARGIPAALVNAGGDLAVYGLPPDGDAWPIAVAGPAGGGGWVVPLQRGALATSGIARRHWRQGAEARHHLLDPRSGLPVRNGLWAVSVAAARCAQAEAAATAAFVLGEEQGSRFLQERGLAGLVVREDGHARPVGPWPVITAGGNA